MIALSQSDGSIITDKDRKIEALIQLQENSLLKMQNFELITHKNYMSEYMRGRDFLITELYDEVWIQQQINEEKQSVIVKQGVMVVELEGENLILSNKISRKNKTILILITVDVVIVLGLILLN